MVNINQNYTFQLYKCGTEEYIQNTVFKYEQSRVVILSCLFFLYIVKALK
jgi:hypothetical protein